MKSTAFGSTAGFLLGSLAWRVIGLITPTGTLSCSDLALGRYPGLPSSGDFLLKLKLKDSPLLLILLMESLETILMPSSISMASTFAGTASALTMGGEGLEEGFFFKSSTLVAKGLAGNAGFAVTRWDLGGLKF